MTVVLVVVINRRLEDHGQAFEPRLVHHVVEGAQAEKAKPDILMQIPMTAKRRLAIIKMERAEILDPDDAIELVERTAESGGLP